MPGGDVDFVAFNLTAQLDWLFLPRCRPAVAPHGLDLTNWEVQFGCKLFIGKVQAHQVQAHHPGSQWPMMTFQDRAGDIIKLLYAALTDIALSVTVAIIVTSLLDLVGAAMWAGDLIGPA